MSSCRATNANRATFLPGVWQHSTDPIARTRWERGEDVREMALAIVGGC